MADNVVANAGSGGATFATDDIAGVMYPLSKLGYGALDSFTIVTTSAGLPVQQQSGANFVVTNAGTFAVQESGGALTALQIIDDWDESDRCKVNPVAGQAGLAAGTGLDALNALRVSLATDIALPAGTNAIGKLAANSGVDIGDVDVLSLPALPTGSNNIGTVELSATALAALETITVAQVTAAIPAGDNNIGNVDIVSLPAGNLGQQLAVASLSTVPASNIADATYIGDIKFGEALPAGTNNIGDIDVLSIAAGDNNIGNVDIASLPAGNLGQQLASASLSTVPASDIADATYVGDIKFGEALPAGTNNIGDVDVLTVPAPLSTTGGGTEATALRVTLASDSTGVLSVDDNGGALTVDNGGTFAVQAGQVAHGAAVSGNPVQTAAEGRTTEGTAVDSGDAVRFLADVVGKQVIEPYALSDLSLQGQTTHSSTTANQELFASGGAGVRNYMTDISISNRHASTGTDVIIKDATSEMFRFPAPAAGGCVHRFSRPIRSTASNAINISTEDAVATVRVSASGYRGR